MEVQLSNTETVHDTIYIYIYIYIHTGSNGGAPRNGNQVQWYYPVTPAPAFHHHPLPYYG